MHRDRERVACPPPARFAKETTIMENCPLIVELASLIIVGGFVGIVAATIGEAIKDAARKHRKKKEDAANEQDLHK